MQRVAPHYSTLLKVDPADRLAYTARLRPEIRFHDGSALAAADVKSTYERIASPPPGVVSARRSLFADLAGIDTPDARTIVFRLRRPNVAFPAILASPWNCLYSAAKLAADPEYPARKVMGTGPFRFGEHVAGAALTNALAGGQTMADFRGVSPAERDRLRAELSTLPGFAADMESARAEARHLLAEAGQAKLAFTFTNRPAHTQIGIFLID